MSVVEDSFNTVPEQEFVFIAVPIQAYDYLRELSKKKDMSVPQLIAWIINKYLESGEIKEKKLLLENKKSVQALAQK